MPSSDDEMDERVIIFAKFARELFRAKSKAEAAKAHQQAIDETVESELLDLIAKNEAIDLPIEEIKRRLREANVKPIDLNEIRAKLRSIGIPPYGN